MHPFDQDIKLGTGQSFSYSGHISGNWSINGVPNGGYIMAVLANAMLQFSDMQATPVITVNFLNRCDPGDAEVAVERMSRSKQFERFQARLLQDGREKARAFWKKMAKSGTKAENWSLFQNRLHSIAPSRHSLLVRSITALRRQCNFFCIVNPSCNELTSRYCTPKTQFS